MTLNFNPYTHDPYTRKADDQLVQKIEWKQRDGHDRLHYLAH